MEKNYIIEDSDGINFYEELYKSLDQPSTDINEELCLITNLPLTENFVELECKHKFNYVPLYNDILIHKKTFNRLESRMLKSNEIRCPYCRNIQTKLLPYYDIAGVKEVHGVNHFDELQEKSQKMNMSDYVKGKCAYITSYTISVNGVETSKKTCCTNTHVKTLDLNGNTYCYHHKYYAIKDYNKTMKQKAKQAKEQAKEQAKQLKEQLKIEKQQAKNDKAKAKAKNTCPQNLSHTEDNVVMNSNGGCSEILKSGPKKGTPCGCKVKQDGFCGRHCKT